jgi:hypothetical protein
MTLEELKLHLEYFLKNLQETHKKSYYTYGKDASLDAARACRQGQMGAYRTVLNLISNKNVPLEK